MTDYAHTPTAERNRATKARTLAAWCWDHGLTSGDVLTLREEHQLLRGIAREATVQAPSSWDTWLAVSAALTAREEWAGQNPGHPLTERPAADQRAHWLPAEEPAQAPTPAVVIEPHREPAPTVTPRGWEALVALGPIPGRIDSRCRVCRLPAVVGDPTGWRCAQHPPQPGEWGSALDWTPRPGRVCAPARCYCGRCPSCRPMPVLPAPTPEEARHAARRR